MADGGGGSRRKPVRELPVIDGKVYDPQEHGARCDRCPLKGNTVVPPQKSGLETNVLFVGEAPGRKEELCLVPETLVLMADLTWRPLGNIEVGDQIITINEHPEPGDGVTGTEGRKWRIASVTGKHEREAETVRVEMASGRDLIGTPDHRVMTAYRKKSFHKKRWLPLSTLQALESQNTGRKRVRANARNSCIAGIGAPWTAATTRDVGWLAGFLDGEGHVAGSKSDLGGKSGAVGFSQNVGPVADYAEKCIRDLGFELRRHEEARSYSGKIIRRAHVAGGFHAWLRFLGIVRPMRLISDFLRVVDRKTSRRLDADPVIRKTKAGKRTVIDITTTAGTFIANGYLVHNCGRPFVGMTGQFLRGLCREVDIDIRHAHLSNAALCRSNIDKENDEAAVCCSPRLLKELAEFDPKIPIVTFGKSSTLSVLGVRSIMHSRGFVWTAREIDAAKAWKEAKKAKIKGTPKWKDLWLKAQIYEGRSKLAGRTVLPTVHPAFVLRSDTWQPILKLDLDRISRWISRRLKKRHLLENGPYVVVTKAKDVKRELRKLKPVVSEDIETGASKLGGSDGANPNRNKMLCIGISDGTHTVVIWPWKRKVHAPILRKFHKRWTTISMHNGYNFDQITLAREGVPFDEIEDKLEDTLIGHHCFASHMPQRLSHVAAVFVDAGPWKITFKKGSDGASEKGLPPEKLPPEELCKYNAADARIQARTWLEMQADLASERHVYEVAKENARLCRSMIINGIGVDLARRSELREQIVKKEETLLAEMRAILKRPAFHPMQLNEVRRALFTTLRAPLSVADPTESGLPSTSSKTLERLKGNATRAGRFADKLLQWRGAVKVRGTYIDSQVLDAPAKKTPSFARTHFNWRSYGAGSGRYSCRLQSCPRAEYLLDGSIVTETRVREVYMAKPGYMFVYFDLSQAEMRSAAYSSGDINFMKTCEGDVHSGNAKILFPQHAQLIHEEPKGRGKPFRDVAKNAGFGVTYLAENETVFQFLRSKGFDVHFKDVAIMMDHMHDAYADYFRYVNGNVQLVSREGHMRSVLTGRIRWLGWHCPPTEVANFPIQSMIADLMNERLPEIRLEAQEIGAPLVAQIHDAAIFETPVKKVDRMKEIIAKKWAKPIVIPANGRYGGSLRPEDGARSFVMPIDLKCKERWSDL